MASTRDRRKRLWVLEVGQPAVQVRAQRGVVGGLGEHEPGHQLLAPALARHAGDGGVGDGGVLEQRQLDLIGAIDSPPERTMSFTRSTIRMRPASSRATRSPVRSHGPWCAAAVASGSRK